MGMTAKKMRYTDMTCHCKKLFVHEAQHGINLGEFWPKMQGPNNGKVIVSALLCLGLLHQVMQHGRVNPALPQVGPATSRRNIRILVALEREISSDNCQVFLGQLQHDKSLRFLLSIPVPCENGIKSFSSRVQPPTLEAIVVSGQEDDRRPRGL